jgi:hypothetical protein
MELRNFDSHKQITSTFLSMSLMIMYEAFSLSFTKLHFYHYSEVCIFVRNFLKITKHSKLKSRANLWEYLQNEWKSCLLGHHKEKWNMRDHPFRRTFSVIFTLVMSYSNFWNATVIYPEEILHADA